MITLRQSTASQDVTIGAFIDDTDFKTPETGLTIANTDIKLIKDGAASVNKNSGGATHRINGEYSITLDATDTNTIGELKVSVKVAGALSVWKNFQVVEEAVYDLFFASGAAPNNLAATDIVTNGAITTLNGVADSDPLYNGAIHVDSINGSSGTTVNTNGTERNPVAGMADVLSLSASTGINVIKVAPGSSLVLTAATTGKLITGSGWSLDLSDEDVSNSTIRGAFVSGTSPNAALVIFETCRLTDLETGPVHAIEGCYISGVYDANSSGPYGFDKIRTVEGSNAKFDFNSEDGTDVTFRQFSGIIAIKSMGPGNKVEFEGRGEITLESDCVDGEFFADGDFRFTNDGSGIAITLSDQTDRLIDVNADTDTLLTYRLGELMSAALASQPFTGSLLGDLTQDNADDAGTQQFSVAALMRVWDELLQGNTHNINNSAGKILRQTGAIIFDEGTLQAGGSNTAQLASGAVDFDGQFARTKFLTVGGLGEGQEFIITDSDESTDTITFTPEVVSTIDNTTEYIIIPAQTHSTVRNGGYDNASVYYDSGPNGSSGTQKGVIGTSTRPVNNFADLLVILAQENLTLIVMAPGSLLTLAADFKGLEVLGSAYDVVLANQAIDNTRFVGANISGIATATPGNPPSFILTGIGTVTLPPCNGFQCGFFGVFTLGSAGNYTFGGSADVFDNELTLDFGAGLNASQFFLQSWGGGTTEIQNAGAGTGTYKFHMHGTGDLTINANCSATTEIRLRGSICLENNASGMTIDQDANFELDKIISDSVAFPGQDIIDINTNVDKIEVAVITNAAGVDISADVAAVKENTGVDLPALIESPSIKKNTAYPNFSFLMVLTSDGKTPATGLTVTGQRRLDNGSFTNVSGTITEVSNGIYEFDALAADTNGDKGTWRFSAATADDTFITFDTVD